MRRKYPKLIQHKISSYYIYLYHSELDYLFRSRGWAKFLWCLIWFLMPLCIKFLPSFQRWTQSSKLSTKDFSLSHFEIFKVLYDTHNNEKLNNCYKCHLYTNTSPFDVLYSINTFYFVTLLKKRVSHEINYWYFYQDFYV